MHGVNNLTYSACRPTGCYGVGDQTGVIFFNSFIVCVVIDGWRLLKSIQSLAMEFVFVVMMCMRLLMQIIVIDSPCIGPK